VEISPSHRRPSSGRSPASTLSAFQCARSPLREWALPERNAVAASRCLEGAGQGYTLALGESKMTLNKMAAIMPRWPIGGATQCSTGFWGRSLSGSLSPRRSLNFHKMFGALCKTI